MSKYSAEIDVAAASRTVTITHNLNSLSARLSGFTPMFPWATKAWVTSRTLNTSTLEFSAQAPSGGGKADVRIIT